MEALLLILLLVVLITLFSVRNSLTQRMSDLHTKIDELSARLHKIQEMQRQASPKTQAPPSKPAETESEKQEVTQTIIPAEAPKVVVERKPEPAVTPSAIEEFSKRLEEQSKIQRQPAPVPVVQTPAKPGFFERNPDLEKFIGENLANKIGIGILVLGIGFFVKFAIDQQWINVYGRVFIGILCGAILLGLAHHLRRTFTAFSSVLIGGGIAVLYLTITIAFHEYHIIGQTVAFLIMVLITAFTILLSISYNRMELAILAILGGFGSPFMVSTGEGNYVVLFTYILILDLGMLVLAYFKKWNSLNIIAYTFTILLFGSWLGARFDPDEPGMVAGALSFATIFYFVFFAMNIVNNLKERTKFKALEISLLLSNTFLYYSAGMYILNSEAGDVFKGLFTASIGVFNFIFAYLLYRNARVDRNLVFLLIGLVLTFISLAAPVQLKGNYITLFWAAEAVLLLWLSQQSGIKLMKLASVVVLGLMLVSLVMDWNNLYILQMQDNMSIILNKGYVTNAVSLISISLFFCLLKFEKQEFTKVANEVRAVLVIVAAAIAYMWNYLELSYQLPRHIEADAIAVIIGSYNMLFILALLLSEKLIPIPDRIKPVLAGFGVLAAFAYLLRYHDEIVTARNNYLEGTASFLGFGFHYLLVVLLVAVCGITIYRLRRYADFNRATFNMSSWFFVFVFIFLASAELDHTVLLTLGSGTSSIEHVITQNHKIGYPILWGVSSFIIIAIGLRKKRRHLRIISLTLFLVTLVKLFLVDIKGISEGGKIAAFISLGVLLLVVSFMYQRLKKFLLADEASEKNPLNNNPVE